LGKAGWIVTPVAGLARTIALFRPVELFFSELHPDRSSAFKRERQLKRCSQARKLALINKYSIELNRLARCHATEPSELLTDVSGLVLSEAETRIHERG
jgi:hypothetical protein